MDNSDFQEVIAQHLKLQDNLAKITELKSSDEGTVFRDRAVRVLWALADYVANTPIPIDGTVLVLHRLMLALADVDRGAHPPIFTPSKGKSINGRAPLAWVHNRRCMVAATVRFLIENGSCKSETQAVKLISDETGIKLGSIKSDLTKALHEPNVDVADPSSYYIPPESNQDGILLLLKGYFSPKP